MAARHILAVDQGTTNTKVLLVDEAGAVVARAARPVDVRFPQPGWVEQDAEALWDSVKEAIDACLAAAGDRRPDAVAVTNQRESVMLWDRSSGRALGPCIVWQCRRTADACAELRYRGLLSTIAEKTGLTIDPLFSATKARWLIDHAPDGPRHAGAGESCVGTVDSWVVWHLSGGAVHATDASNASRTQLMNLASVSWDPDLLDVFGIPAAALPAIRPSSGIVGETVRAGRLPAGIPIASLAGDSHAALFGQSAGVAGVVKATYGTGSSLMTLVERPLPSRAGLSTTVAWRLPGGTAYALEGNITATGGAVDWLGRLLARTPAEIASLAMTVSDSGGVVVVPAFAGLGAPHWDDAARGLVCGLTRGTTAAHLARATLESIALQVRDVFDAMQSDVGGGLQELLADGGASDNDSLMQLQADVLGLPVVRNRSADLSAVGAAWLAGLAIGLWSLEDLRRLPRAIDRFEPRMIGPERDRLLEGWRAAVARTRLR